jgi:metallo-beta-lactamase class B
MRALTTTTLLMLWGTLASAQPRPFRADPPRSCQACDEWNAKQEPFRVFGNTWYVGTAGLGAVLITSPTGHVLLDGGLTQSAPLIDASIRALGFRTEDVKLIVSSHAHADHAGGIAALQRASGAQVAASAAGARALERGGPTADDPQYAFDAANGFPRVKHVRVARDGETLRAGEVAITAHYTPGHTPGATTWSWRSCEHERCLDIVYADSLNALSAAGFRFTGDASHPSIADSFRHSTDVVAGLPCDVLLTVHPGFSRMFDALRSRGVSPDAAPVVDREACRAYAKDARERLERRLAAELATRPPATR